MAGLFDSKCGSQTRETGTHHAHIDISHADNAYRQTAEQSIEKFANRERQAGGVHATGRLLMP